ncbi:MAG TPA: glycosyltransferase family 2 protein [Actinomycetales bacterium]|nr:glycosyltransferase family 2 protein [Actinomycetales bacterium]
MTASTEQELVTVVIPARNEDCFIGACLDAVLAQTYENLQVIVVDGASDDRTQAIVKQRGVADERVELLVNPRRLIPISLNLALAAARGVWLVRIDAHATVPPDYVGRCVELLREGRWQGVGGRKDGVGVTPAGRAVAAAMASRFGVGNSTYHYGTSRQAVDHVPFGAYPVDTLRTLGGWEESLAVNQDFELDYRIREHGGTLLFDPGLVIHWHCRQTVPDLYRQYRRYGRGKTVVASLHPASMRWRHLMAPALVAWLMAALAIAPRRPRAAVLATVPYLAALTAGTATTSRRLEEPAARLLVAPAFVAMHVGWGVGFWQGVVQLTVGRFRGTRPRRPS